MNGFVILLSVIFGTALIIGSVQYVAADHLEPGKGILQMRELLTLLRQKVRRIKSTYKVLSEMEMENSSMLQKVRQLAHTFHMK